MSIAMARIEPNRMRHARPIPDRRLIEFCIAQIDGAIAKPSAFAVFGLTTKPNRR
jgi:hypothetical protein